MELVARAVATEVRQRIDDKDAGIRAEPVLVPLDRGQAADSGTDHDEVVFLARVLD